MNQAFWRKWHRWIGKPSGGEDRRLIIDAKSGALLRSDGYVDKPLINRVHSGEFFGDGGLVFAMLWGTASLVLVVSGIIIYWAMRRRSATGLQRLFW